MNEYPDLTKTCWQPTQFFFIYSQKVSYTPYLITKNHCCIVLLGICFIFCDNHNLISIQFSQLKVWKHLSRCLDCRRLLLIFFYKRHLTIGSSHDYKRLFKLVFLPWLHIWICLIGKPISMKIHWSYSDLIKVMMDLVLYVFILIAMGSWLVYYMRNSWLHCSKNSRM
jgi:hypothetical protein